MECRSSPGRAGSRSVNFPRDPSYHLGKSHHFNLLNHADDYEVIDACLRPRRPDHPVVATRGRSPSTGTGSSAGPKGVVEPFVPIPTWDPARRWLHGSALFGFPIAAGIPGDEVAAFLLGVSPDEYVDVDWRLIASALPHMGKGFGGVIRGERTPSAMP